MSANFFNPVFGPAGSVISSLNSSIVTLAASGVFTGVSEPVQDYATIVISVFSNVASATLGLSIQQSSNGTNWDIADTYTIAANSGKTFSIGPSAQFFRIVYTNGATLQTSFRLLTVFHTTASRSSSHSLAEAMTNQNDAELVIAQLRANNGTNLVPLNADVSGNLLVTAASLVNTNGSIVNTSLTATTASSVTAPTNAVGFIFEAPSTNTDNIRWCLGGTSSATVGMLCEPGRDSGYVPAKATISVCSTVSGTNAFSVQWILSV